MSYHELYRVTDFEIVGDYTLHITFDDGSEQIVNLRPVLYGEVFGPLRDLAFFNQVRLDPEAETLVWTGAPSGPAAFDPETLRNWPQYEEELARCAQSWASVAA